MTSRRLGGKLHPRFQHSPDPLVVELVVACIGTGTSVAGRRQVEEDSLVTYLLKLLVGRFVAVLDGNDCEVSAS